MNAGNKEENKERLIAALITADGVHDDHWIQQKMSGESSACPASVSTSHD